MPRNFGLPSRDEHRTPIWPFVVLALAVAAFIGLWIFD
jgi:hypothetical protein